MENNIMNEEKAIKIIEDKLKSYHNILKSVNETHIDGFEFEEACEFILNLYCTEKLENRKIIEPINAYKLIEAPWAANKLKEMNYDTFMEHLKQSEIEIVTKISEIIDYINNEDKR